VLPPTITPYATEFYGPVNVTITPATAGSTIYYTKDFSTVTTGSTPYAPFTLTASATIRARAYKAGMKESTEAQVFFRIDPLPSPTGLRCDPAGPGAWKASWSPVAGAVYYKYTTVDGKNYNTGSALSSTQSSSCAWVKACISETNCSFSANF